MHHTTTTTETTTTLYGLVARFGSAEEILDAAHKAYEAGYRKMDAYSPFPVHGLSDAIGFRDIAVPWIIFLSGLAGGLLGYGLEYFVAVIDYPLNVGGRPFHSWPSFIPVAYEATILCAAFGAVLGMLGLNGLPRPHHSIFNAPEFDRATQDKFFLCIEARDPKFDAVETAQFLRSLDPEAVDEVEK